MKATLEFNMREERAAYSNATHADDMARVIWEIESHCRAWTKHGGHGFKTPEDVMHWVRATILDDINRQMDNQ